MERIVFSRKDTFLNNMKNSTPQGIAAVIMEIISFIMIIAGIIWSISAEGKAGYELGLLILFSLILSIIGVVLAAKGLKNRNKIRHNLERHAIFLGVILIVVLIGFYIWGIYTYLN